MIDTALLSRFTEQFRSLKAVVSVSKQRAIQDPPDFLFAENQNVFVKLYLVSACSMLEAFVQDLAYAYVEELQRRINSLNFPFNLMMWVAEQEKAKLEFKRFEALKGPKDMSDLISPNYWQTIKAFSRIGIDLSRSPAASYKDFIVTTVEKRNRIVHHNDAALDLSFLDIERTINEFELYTQCLFETVLADPHLSMPIDPEAPTETV